MPATGPTPLTTAAVVGVGSGPFGPVLALLVPAGLAGGMFVDMVYTTTFFHEDSVTRCSLCLGVSEYVGL